MRIDASGNMGQKVTPSPWATFSVLQQANGSLASVGTQTQVIQNAYFDGSNMRYITSNGASRYGQDVFGGATHYWYNAPSGTAGNVITFTQAMTLNANSALVLKGGNTSATGVGIAFPATQSASTDANTLDDYEEGTFTPTLTFGGGSTGITYNAQVGRYTKVGRLVTVSFTIQLTNKGSSTGDAKVSLPFSSDEYAQPNLPGYTSCIGYTNLGTVGFIVGNNGAAGLPFLTSTGAYLTNSSFTNSSYLVMTVSYNV
jgi:hypothetical protein